MAMENNKLAKVENNLSEDRISRLPDDILHCILSFLTTKEAFVTSILSTRWRCLLKSIPSLDFVECWPRRLGFASDDATLQKAALRFMNFVDRLLFLRNVLHIQKVSILWVDLCDLFRVNGWIATVICRHVEELILYRYFGYHAAAGPIEHLFPSCLFRSDSLTVLKINMGNERVVKLPSFISLPKLKVLHLSDIVFGDKNSFEQLFSKCPVLEELNFNLCSWIIMEKVCVSAPSLKSLIISHVVFYKFGIDDCIMISAPSLVSFEYAGTLAKDYIFPCKSMLVDATMDLVSYQALPEETGYAASKLLEGLSNVKILKVSYNTSKTISSVDFFFQQNRLEFHNLHRLELIDNIALDYESKFIRDESKFIRDLISVSPNLEMLVFAKGIYGYRPGSFNANWVYDTVPECLMLHLKTVEFRKFRWSDDELYLVEWFLKNSRVLERMTVISSDDLRAYERKKLNVLEQLLILPRASEHCTLDFS